MYFEVFTSSKESSGCWCMWWRHAWMVSSFASNSLTVAFIGIPPEAVSRNEDQVRLTRASLPIDGPLER